MTAAAARPDAAGRAARWAACGALIVALHAGGVALLLRARTFLDPPSVPQNAILLDLAPEPATPEPAAPEPEPAARQEPPPEPAVAEPPPDPAEADPAEAEAALAPVSPPVPVPVSVPVPVPVPEAAVLLPAMPPPPRPVKPPARRPPAPARETTAPKPRETPPLPAPGASPPAAIAPPAITTAAIAAPPASSTPSWRAELIGRLQRAKRYPDTARSHGERGVAYASFTMSRGGQVLAVSLVRSSGSTALDEEAVALIRRAEPLPPLPAEMPGNSITLTVPVNFDLH